MRRVLTATVLAGTLVVGSASAALAAERPSGERRGDRCARLAERLEQVPAIRARIGSQITRIEERVAAVTPPSRRAVVEARVAPRLERLRGVDARIADLAARAEARCPA